MPAPTALLAHPRSSATEAAGHPWHSITSCQGTPTAATLQRRRRATSTGTQPAVSLDAGHTIPHIQLRHLSMVVC